MTPPLAKTEPRCQTRFFCFNDFSVFPSGSVRYRGNLGPDYFDVVNPALAIHITNKKIGVHTTRFLALAPIAEAYFGPSRTAGALGLNFRMAELWRSDSPMMYAYAIDFALLGGWGETATKPNRQNWGDLKFIMAQSAISGFLIPFVPPLTIGTGLSLENWAEKSNTHDNTKILSTLNLVHSWFVGLGF